MKRETKIESVIPYNHKVLVTPLCIPTAIVGAVVAVQPVGAHILVVDGFDATESLEIETALNANRGVYCSLGTSPANKIYRITKATKTANVITSINIYPALEVATTIADVLTVGGSTIAIDIGIIADEGLSITRDLTHDDALSEYGTVISRISRMENAMLKSPATLLNIDNYLLLAPNSFFVNNDTDVKFNYGSNAGFFEAVECSVKVVSAKDPADISKWINADKCLLTLTEFNLAGNKDRTKSMPVEFLLNNSGALFSFGDKTATYTGV
jgi:hypothetical protein